MDPLQDFLARFGTSSQAETEWLQNIFTFITEHLSALTCGPAPPGDPAPPGGPAPPGVRCCCRSVLGLSVSLVQRIQEQTCVSHTLPVTYRLLSVSCLLSQQRLACVSNLSWSTNQQRAWEKEAELSVPGGGALPRVKLLLIGCLREGRGGELRLTEGGDSVRCECLSPSPLWLHRPVFLPHWNYIPQNAPGQEEAGGCLELIGPPVPLCPGPEQGLAAAAEGAGPPPAVGAGPPPAVGVREAARLLGNRVRGRRLAVFGQVGSVCPLLVVMETAFFCFTLTDQSESLPVLVKDSRRLWWSQCVCVGQSVCVTALRVCVLRGWRGNNILSVTDRSQIHTNYTPIHTPTHTPTEIHTNYTLTHTPAQIHTNYTLTHTHTPAEPDTPTPMTSWAEDSEGEEPEGDLLQSGALMKQSKVISYQGTVTEVVSEGAGLYVIDRTVGLCLAYQPPGRRKLRPGDRVELHHVHFLSRASPDFPPRMLCCCLRSSVRVVAFSRVGGASAGPSPRCPGDGALPRLLLQRNVGVSEYLWACHLSSQLSHSLVPALMEDQCVCVLSWRLMETLWTRRGRRDIYSEMLEEPHTCPLSQYSVDPAVPQYSTVSDVLQCLRGDIWSSLSLASLLPPGGSSLSRSQINSALSWSCRTLSSDPRTGDSLRPRPLLLVGLLELPSHTSELKHCLQLRDATGAVGCVVTETSPDHGGQRSPSNTAWIGCLVCVFQFTMVTERFLQSDFPSYQHLDQDKFITHRHSRVYLQFSLDHAHILSPSVAMVTHLRQKQEAAAEEEEEETAARKRRRREEDSSSASSSSSSVTVATRPCISMVIRVEQKEGVAWRNTGAGTKEEEAGLRLSFSVRAAVIGPVVSWGRDPKNGPMTERETTAGTEDKVVLLFSGVSTRWFPVLQPGRLYRLTATNTQDPSVLIGSGVSGRRGVELHTDSALQVRSDWKFHTLPRPLLLPSCRQGVLSPVLSVSEVLDCSSELVCLQGDVLDRISLRDTSTGSGDTHTGVRLTLCDQTGRSLQVYLDLSHTPYPPGLLPGNTLLLSSFQRRVSRTGSVYCSHLPVSCITVTSLGDGSCVKLPPSPMMHLGQWALNREHRCIVGQVKGHVVCFLFLELQWSCSLCGSLYTECCSSSQCRSTSSVFESKAKVVVDDGTGEAHVWVSGALVRPLLGLADSQWEGLQRVIRVKGHIRVYPRGRSLVCGGDSEDPLLHFLLCLCSSHVVCRPLSLTCRKQTNQTSEGKARVHPGVNPGVNPEVRRFSRGDRDFVTRLTRPLQLTCLLLST